MKHLYLLLDLGSLIIPLIFSFHPKIKFYKEWKFVFPSIAVMCLIFIPWDIIFTQNKVWGFNQNYLAGLNIFNLPLEEWLFFLCIPYASLFTHFCLKKLFFKRVISNGLVKFITINLFLLTLILALTNVTKQYTFYNFLLCSLVLAIVYLINSKSLNTFYLSFLIILIPFFLVNGILTGSLINEPIVWYNNSQNLGIRILTIPFEDFFYALSMLLIPQFLTDLLRNRSTSL